MIYHYHIHIQIFLYQSSQSVIKAIDRHGNVVLRVLYDLTNPHRIQIANTAQAHCDFGCQDTADLQPRSGFPENTRKERGLFSTLSEHNPIRPGRINGGGFAFNAASRGIGSYYHDRVPGLVLTYLLRVSE